LAVYLYKIRRRESDRCTTRSHVLLHCNGDRLAAARTLAWEGRHPPSIWVLLGDPRWEARLLRFIELSGIGRVVGEVDVEEEWAVRLDGWVTEERGEV